jgi:hypothetical protein
MKINFYIVVGSDLYRLIPPPRLDEITAVSVVNDIQLSIRLGKPFLLYDDWKVEFVNN